jgi:hypothetical protein
MGKPLARDQLCAALIQVRDSVFPPKEHHLVCLPLGTFAQLRIPR